MKNVYNEGGVRSKIIDRQKRNKTTEGFDNLSYLLEHYQFKNSQVRSLGYAYYDTNGKIIESYSATDDIYGSWIDIIPGSVWELSSKQIWSYVHANWNTVHDRSY